MKGSVASVSAAEQTQKSLAYAATRRSQALEILQSSTITDEIPCPDEAEFREHPLQLALSGLFCETNLVYTLEEYAEHLQLTKAFATEHANYSAVRARDNAFANIQILVYENSFVMISKNTAPTVHFVIRHPVLRNALENLEFPVLCFVRKRPACSYYCRICPYKREFICASEAFL